MCFGKIGSMCNYTAYSNLPWFDAESTSVCAESRKPHPPKIEIGSYLVLQIVQHLH